MIQVREIAHGSAEYRRAVEVRKAILRIPLGLDLSADDLAAETGDLHLGAFCGDQLVGCLVLTPQGISVRMRQVAVAEHFQKRGVGRLMVEASEERARSRGFSFMTLHARESAVPFYLSQGYALEGEGFTEVGLPHRAMRKPL